MTSKSTHYQTNPNNYSKRHHSTLQSTTVSYKQTTTMRRGTSRLTVSGNRESYAFDQNLSPTNAAVHRTRVFYIYNHYFPRLHEQHRFCGSEGGSKGLEDNARPRASQTSENDYGKSQDCQSRPSSSYVQRADKKASGRVWRDVEQRSAKLLQASLVDTTQGGRGLEALY